MTVLRQRWCFCILCAILAAALVALLLSVPTVSSAADPPEKPLSFIADVAPILKEHCMACHNNRRRAGKLDMTSLAQLRHGGAHDDPIVPGHPDESRLIQRLRAEGAQRMPPPPNDLPNSPEGALPPEKAAILARWIRDGAKLDTELSPNDDLPRELRKRWQPPIAAARYAQAFPITALAFTPDGGRLVAGGRHELTIWNSANGQLTARLQTRAERAYGIAFLTDNRIAVAGGRPGQEGDVRIYDLAGPAASTENGVARLNGVSDPHVMIAHLMDTDDSMLCLAVSPDRKMLAAAGCDKLIRVWRVAPDATAQLDQSIDVHSDWVLGLAFSPDGQRLVTAGRDKTCKLWDLTKRESVQSFSEHSGPAFGATLSRDGKSGLSVGADKMMRIWAADGSAKAIKSVGGHTDGIFKIAAVSGQPQVVTCSADATVRLWGEDGSAVRTFAGLTDQAFSLAVSPDGARIAAGASNGQVCIWKIADGAVLANFSALPGFTPKVAAK
jgi:WD40 repeat protein